MGLCFLFHPPVTYTGRNRREHVSYQVSTHSTHFRLGPALTYVNASEGRDRRRLAVAWRNRNGINITPLSKSPKSSPASALSRWKGGGRLRKPRDLLLVPGIFLRAVWELNWRPLGRVANGLEPGIVIPHSPRCAIHLNGAAGGAGESSAAGPNTYTTGRKEGRWSSKEHWPGRFCLPACLPACAPA